MTELWIHPALILLVGAALLPLVPERIRAGYLLLVPLLVFARVHGMAQGVYGEVRYLSWDLIFGRVDALASLFGYILALMAVLGTLYALKVRKRGEFAAAWVYVAGSLGVVYAGDLLTLFLFWEMMALASVFLIWLRGRRESLAAGFAICWSMLLAAPACWPVSWHTARAESSLFPASTYSIRVLGNG
ncbi:MAG: hypothetical protein R2864_12395 [Syntrophotaleaceae bacterium]